MLMMVLLARWTVPALNVKPFWEDLNLKNQVEHDDDCDSINSDFGEIIKDPKRKMFPIDKDGVVHFNSNTKDKSTIPKGIIQYPDQL